jgi:tetratricopeptide (TPR) repeat protein
MKSRRSIAMLSLSLVSAAALVASGAERASGQADEGLRNLQYFSPDITRDSLVQVMRRFSLSLGVRCQYCHVGGDGVSFEGVEFDSDADPDKRKARFMLRMVDTINRSMLPMMTDRDEPGYEIECKSCHRGRPKPELLTDVLRRTLDEAGLDSTAATYRRLREGVAINGMFDFGEWETNLLAERLEGEGRLRDAIGIYELNAEYYPRSVSIAMSLGQLYEEVDDRDAAIRSYERALQLQPGHGAAQARLDALRGGR